MAVGTLMNGVESSLKPRSGRCAIITSDAATYLRSTPVKEGRLEKKWCGVRQCPGILSRKDRHERYQETVFYLSISEPAMA